MVRVLALTALLLVAPAGFAAEAKSAEKQSLTKEQNEAAQVALKALRKLNAAVVIGVTQNDYRERLIDTKVTVEEQTRKLPDGPAKAHLGEAVETYRDAFTLWRNVTQYPFKDIFKRGESFAFIAKYHLEWTEPKEDPEEIPDWQQHVWVSQIWDAARGQTERAEAAAQ